MVLNRATARACEVVPGLNVRLGAAQRPHPGRGGGSAGQRRGRRSGIADVLLVVEITSPSNFRQDRIVKHGEYAEAGIPFYVRVDLHLGVEELTATAYELVDG